MLRWITVLLLSVALWAGTAEDNRLSSRLRQKLSRSKLKQDGVKFSVQDGVVTWTGQVKVPQRKGAATRMAKTAGASRVVNQITVDAVAKQGKTPVTPRPGVFYTPKR